jgi:CubicO group peptidase (beta-lactamase class C family)
MPKLGRKSLRNTWGLLFVLLTGLGLALSQDHATPLSRATSPEATIQSVASAYAQDAVNSGNSIGIEVGVIYESLPPQLIRAGSAGPDIEFSNRTAFQIGSVTKVFTTNLLGQYVWNGSVSLSSPLSSFQNVMGKIQNDLTGKVTFLDLADFTGGFPSLAELCITDKISGCLPSQRPTIAQYGAGDFAHFFQTAVPMNFITNTPATSIPAPYNYSDFSTGLLGLLLGDPSGAAFTDANDDPLTGWWIAVQDQILFPLAMSDTFLHPPQLAPPPLLPLVVPPPPIASGYAQALATATVSDGAISAITMTSAGSGYTTPPKVTITGGGGKDATTVSKINSNGTLNTISVVNGGSGYIAPAAITFSGGAAEAKAIVQGGKVVAVNIANQGNGYLSPPAVSITGGRAPAGTDATLVAHLANGKLVYVEVTDGGSGYVQPLTIIVAPGIATSENIPIWAPAGALSSSMSDMVNFAAAALGKTTIMGLGSPVPPAMTHGFEIAEEPRACFANVPLADCPAGSDQSALAWAVIPADAANGVPKVIFKNGGLGGFSTQVMLVPSRNLAVVVFSNSRQVLVTGEPTVEAGDVASNILYSLLNSL